MGRKEHLVMPTLNKLIKELGENIRFARLRRKFSAELLAERAGISRPTLRAIERGDPKVSFAAYANVLACLGLEKDLAGIARDDELGRKLQDAELSPKKRAPKVAKK